MNAAIEAFDNEWKTGDRAKAKEMAREYVEANRDNLMANIQAAVRTVREARLDDSPSIVDLVDLVSAYRAAGFEEDRILVDMVLLADYQPQRITGAVTLSKPLRQEVG